MSTRAYTEVYRALDRRTGMPAAIKLLDLDRVSEIESRRFEVDLKVIEAIGHPNVMPILAHGLAPDGRKWIAMPLATASLADLAHAVGRSPGAIADVMRQVCAGIASAHRERVFHGDVKPENILRQEDGAWALADFCLPTQLSREDSESLIYMAPELLDGSSAPSIRSDVYSLGRVLQALTYRNPSEHLFRTASVYSTHDEPSARYQTASDFAKGINESLTATQEIKTWASASAAADELRERARGTATPPEDLYRILEWASRLSKTDDNDMRALSRVLPWLNDRALQTLMDQNSELFEDVFAIFGTYLQNGDFEHEYYDDLADFTKRVNSVFPSPAIFESSIRYLAVAGERYANWHVRDVLVELLTHVQDERLAAAAVRALTTLDQGVVTWNITAFALRALPTGIRTPLSDWLARDAGKPYPL